MTKAGEFTIDDSGVLSGPAVFMEEEGNAILDRILAGNDTVFNMSAHLSPSVEMAICVRLQTAYAGWIGARRFFAAFERK